MSGSDLEHPAYSSTGHVLYSRRGAGGGLWALPVSKSTLEPTGNPFLIDPSGVSPSASTDGTLTYVRGFGSERRLVVVNQDGQIEPISGEEGKYGRIAYPNVLPDGARVACSVTHNDDIDVWLFRLDDGAPTRLTFGDGDYLWPRWMPGGDVIVATRRSEEGDAAVFLSADGGGEVRDAIAGSQFGIGPDGASIVVMRFSEETGREFWLVPLDESDAATLILESTDVVKNMAFSPDGAWLAYEVDEGSDRGAIYLTRFPSEQGRWQVAEGGAREPIWTADGAQLFFRHAYDRIMAVDVTTEPTLSLGQPRAVLRLQKQGLISFRGFGITPDGQRLLVTQATGSDNARPTIAVVENWIEEFREGKGQ